MEKTPEIKQVGTQLNLFGAPVPQAPKNHTPKKPKFEDELDDESEEEEMSEDFSDEEEDEPEEDGDEQETEEYI